MTGQIEGRLWDAQIQLLAISDTKIPAIALDEGVLGLSYPVSKNFQGSAKQHLYGHDNSVAQRKGVRIGVEGVR